MQAYVMDAFSAELFGGNQAGVVLPDRELEEPVMRQIAGELKHSETAFVRFLPDGAISVRYFTPAGEVDLCGHATIGTFALLRQLGKIGDGLHTARTLAGNLAIEVAGSTVWMEMGQAKVLRQLTEAECPALYEAYGLTADHRPADLLPQIVSTGLADILLPVRDHDTLMAARQDAARVTELSRQYEVVGVHMFCLGEGDCTAYCSNFAPLYDIPEECATGTSNGALTYYLYGHGLVAEGQENLFIQGQHMGRPSQIRSRLTVSGGEPVIRIGGQAVMSFAGQLNL